MCGRGTQSQWDPIPASLALEGGSRAKPGGARPCWAPWAPGAEEEPGSIGGWGWPALPPSRGRRREASAQSGGRVGRRQRLQPGAGGP